MTKQITEDMAGCWLGGHHGWHNNYEVVNIAEQWGFKLDADDRRMLDVYRLSGDVGKVTAFLMKEAGFPATCDEYIHQFSDGEHEARAVVYGGTHMMAELAADELAENAAEVVTGQGGLSDKATEYLDSLAPDGMAFHWDDGLALMCLCQIEGTEENGELMKTDKYYCERCEGRYSK